MTTTTLAVLDIEKGNSMNEREEERRMREEISRLEERRRQLSGEVMEGKLGALEEDEQLERRIFELARRLQGGKV